MNRPTVFAFALTVFARTVFALCTALLTTPALCQGTDPGGTTQREPIELRIDPAVVPADQTAKLRLDGGHAGALFLIVAADRPLTANSLVTAALLDTTVVAATGRLDHRGHATIALQPPEAAGQWHYAALAFCAGAASDTVQCSDSQPVRWLAGAGNGNGQIGIDTPPTVTYSTQFGGAGTQSSRFMTTDGGFLYLTGADGPLVNSPGDADPNGGTWIAKLDPSNNGDLAIVWTTILGNGGNGMNRHDIVAGGGHVFVCGWAIRGDLALGSVFDPTKNIFRDGYVAMFDASDGTRLATTYLSQQGSPLGDNTQPQAMQLVGNDLYVAGWASHDGIWTTNGFDATYDGGIDAFLMKLSITAPDGIALAWSTYLPGGGDVDSARAILVDGSSIYVAGITDSDLVLPGGGFQSGSGGNRDTFCLRILDGAAPTLAAGTYLGGSRSDTAEALSLDPSGDLWLGGSTSSPNFPVTTGAYDTTLGGKSDAFVARLSSDLSQLVFGSYFGGSGDDSGHGMVAHGGLVYLVGQTRSSDLPVVDPLPGFGSKSGREDAFFARLDATGQPETATYYGGSRTESANAGLEVDAAGTAWFGGQMDSSNVSLTSPTSYGGDFYVAGFEFAPPPPPPSAPSTLTATAASSSAIDLSWVDTSGDETGFRIERSPDSVQWNAVASVGSNVTSHTDDSLAPSTTYHYRVIAFNAGGDSAPSNVATATTLTGPANPTIVSITPNSMDAGTTASGVVIDGTGFQPGAVVTFESGQGPTPTTSNLSITSTQITLDISVSNGGPPGNRTWNVVVTNPDQGSATLTAGFTVVK